FGRSDCNPTPVWSWFLALPDRPVGAAAFADEALADTSELLCRIVLRFHRRQRSCKWLPSCRGRSALGLRIAVLEFCRTKASIRDKVLGPDTFGQLHPAYRPAFAGRRRILPRHPSPWGPAFRK